MKRLLLVLAIFGVSISQTIAQKLIIGERAPELKVKEWISSKSADSGARLVEFFFSSSKPSVDRLTVVNGLAKKYAGRLSVIVIAKEPKEKVEGILNPSSNSYLVAMDDAGKTFDSYGIQFVPFSVIIDSKGRIAWFGNSTSLTEETINKHL